MSNQAIDGFWINIVADVVVLGLTALLKWVHGKLALANPADRVWRVAAVGIFWIVINTAYAYFFARSAALIIFLSSVLIGWIVRSELNQFWRIGLVGADDQIQAGINFKRALGMVSNSMDFLGIGAAKLTDEKTEFEAAVGRCQRPSRPVRFLLCRPDSDKLIEMAQSAEKDRDLYQKKVLDSSERSRTSGSSERGTSKSGSIRSFLLSGSCSLTTRYALQATTFWARGPGQNCPSCTS